MTWIYNKTEYKLKDSKANDYKMYSFAWGIWHDSAMGKSGCTFDDTKAKEGYERAKALASDSDKNWYSIQKSSAFSDLVEYANDKDKENKKNPIVYVKKAIEKRLKDLNGEADGTKK